MIKFGKMSRWISEIPNKKELEKLSIRDLILIATHKKIMGSSFKAHLMEYIMKFKKIGYL